MERVKTFEEGKGWPVTDPNLLNFVWKRMEVKFGYLSLIYLFGWL